MLPLQWRHNECDDVSNHRHLDCLLNRLSMRKWKKSSKLGVTCLCEGNSSVTGEFPTQRASNAENVSIWWRHDCASWHTYSWASVITISEHLNSKYLFCIDQCMPKTFRLTEFLSIGSIVHHYTEMHKSFAGVLIVIHDSFLKNRGIDFKVFGL